MIKKFKSLITRYGEIIRYLIVGGLTTVVSLGIYYGLTLTHILNAANPVQLQAANVLSWIGAVAFAYWANRRFVFDSHNPNRLAEAGSFVAGRVGTLLMDMAFMFITVSLIRMDDRIAKLLDQILITVANYVISKWIVFRKR